jgi:hypothetical protein
MKNPTFFFFFFLKEIKKNKKLFTSKAKHENHSWREREPHVIQVAHSELHQTNQVHLHPGKKMEKKEIPLLSSSACLSFNKQTKKAPRSSRTLPAIQKIAKNTQK